MNVLYHQARNPQTKTEEKKKNDSLSKVSHVYLCALLLEELQDS